MNRLHPNNTTLRIAAAVGLGLIVVTAGTVLTQRTEHMPGAMTDATVVATLKDSGRVYPEALQSHLRAARQKPDDPMTVKAAARALIGEGRAAGDSRLVGAALGVLRPLMATPDTETLYLAATARQYQHDFPAALALLDEAIRLDPGDVNSILTRATVQIVLGRFDLAGEDCRRLNELQRPEIGFLCQATNGVLTADAPRIYDRLAAIVASPGLLDASLLGWAVGLQGEIAGLQGNNVAARRHLADVVAADPTALRERLLLADLLLKEGKGAEATAVLEPAVPVDGVLIRRVMAAEMRGDTATASKETAELDRRVKQNIDLGLTAHAREDATYFLHIAKDPMMALERAKVNWAMQHEIEDAQLLVDAAVFAGQPEAAAPVLQWMQEQGVVVPTFRLPDAVREAAK